MHILALTATLTTTVFKAVKKRLSLNDPAVIGISPDRTNIKYHVEPKETIVTLRGLLIDKLLAIRTKFPKTLIFFKTVKECAAMYKDIRRALGEDFTEPPRYPDYHQFRMVDMFTRPTSESMKKKILSLFQTAGSKLRILFATTAFSMGIDVQTLKMSFTVVHLPPLNSTSKKLAGLAETENRKLLYCMESLGSMWMKQWKSIARIVGNVDVMLYLIFFCSMKMTNQC